MIINISPPYDYKYVIKRLQYDPTIDVDEDRQVVKVPLNVYGDDIIVQLFFNGTMEDPVCTANIPVGYEADAVEKINQIFQFETSLQEVSTHFHGTVLEPLFQQFRGLPLTCDCSLYFSIMKTIIHQQLNLSFAQTLTERFVQSFGEEKNGFLMYPTPERISKLDYEDLRKLQFSQRKAEYVIDTSKIIANGELNLEELRLKKDEEIIEELVKIRGIGYWTAENILLFGLGRKNLFPVKDIGIQNAIKKLYQLEKKPSIDELQKLSVQWEPYKSYASLYLWASLNNQ